MFELKNFRTIALLEATSFLLLLIATVVKHAADQPIGVEILGPIHGALFLAYGALALAVRSEAGWNLTTTLAVLLGAVLPFGGFVVDRYFVEPKLRRATAQ